MFRKFQSFLLHLKAPNALLNFVFRRAPKLYEPMNAEQKIAADTSLCMFFIKNGLPLKAVNDRNLEMLAFNMNSEYEMPTVDVMYEIMQEIADSKNVSIKIQRNPSFLGSRPAKSTSAQVQ